jgi:hypothetical protein
MELKKATLTAHNSEVPDIEFMFNPAQIAFEGVVETADNPGSRSERSGRPKVSFSNIQAYKITINNILFDTYETGENVVEKYIERFKLAVKFVEGKQRPPIYCFAWTDKPYLQYCFVERLSYKLTMFLPNGTPVRAVIDSLTLKETDGIPSDNSSTPRAQPNPNDTMANRRTQAPRR